MDSGANTGQKVVLSDERELGAGPVSFATEGVNQSTATRVVHVIGGLGAKYGGPSYSVPRLCQALAAAGADATLLSVAQPGLASAEGSTAGFLDRRFLWDYARTPILRNLRSSSGMWRELRSAAPICDVIHNHGLWLMPNIYASLAAERTRTPLIISPRGMLSPAALQFSRVKKQVFWKVFQGRAVYRATCMHATSQSEYEEIRGLGIGSPITIIPNGIDLPEFRSEPEARFGRTAIALGRIHPKKGLDRLLLAWANVEKSNPQWRLRIIGPSEAGHADGLRAQAEELNLRRVSIEGPIYGEDKLAVYREADLFVLSSLNENFGITVAEALSAGTPVLSTKGAPWSGLEDHQCGWWVDHGIEPLSATLANAMIMPRAALKAMGAKGRTWMERDFSWDRVAREMLDVYRWLAQGVEAPSTVQFH